MVQGEEGNSKDMTDNEFLLFDRLEVIKATINKYGEENFYLSFSGGKDSTVVYHLLDMAIPDNKIPRVFCNTGIEYLEIVKFVKSINDERIEIITPKKNIVDTLNKVGYPFKSKEHSLKVGQYQKGSRCKSVMKYKEGYFKGSKYQCPEMLLYQYEDDFKLKLSNKCCYEFKKKPFKKWEKENNKGIAITGMMKDEGGQRTSLNCIVYKNDKAVKFHPLAKVNKQWCDWFIETYNIEICSLYKPPYNFERTGCKGCPFALRLQEQLALMQMYLPNERIQCETIWEPVYEEYRRIGYRLDKEEQLKLL